MPSSTRCLVAYFLLSLHWCDVYAAEKATYQPIDWNGDGAIDLVDLSSDKQGEATLRIYMGIPESKPPRFSPPERIIIEDQPPSLTVRSFADWDGDGDVDLLACAGDQVYVWENTAERAARIRLDAPPKLVALGPSDIRQELSRFNKSAKFHCQAIAAADWEGDGDQDLLVVMANGDGDLAVFELLKRTAAETTSGTASYATPVAIRDDRGLPVMSSAGLAVRSILYVDWDRDGDMDLLYFDTTTRPSDAGGWLMYVENDNTRQKPLFIRPFTILPISGAPFLLDWNKDGQIDLIAGGEPFTNVNPRSAIHLPVEPAFRPGGSRRPHPWTLPRFESGGAVAPATPE